MLPDLKLDTEGWEVLIKRVLEKGDKNHDGSFDFVSAAPFAGYCELHNNRPNFALSPNCLQGQLCKLPLFRVVFNRKLGDHYAIRSSAHRTTRMHN
jgi:hypothetical protein